MGAAMKRLPAHVGSRLAGNAQREQHLSLQRAPADGVTAIVGEPDRVVGRHEDAVGAGKHSFSEGAQEIAVAVEHDHWMLAAIEHIDIVVPVDADAADFLE